MGRFAGKNVFITGAGSGFGQRTAELFALEGAEHVYLVDRLQERLDITTERVAAAGATPVSICTDLGVMSNASDAIGTGPQRRPEARRDDQQRRRLGRRALPRHDRRVVAARILSVNLDAYFVLAHRAANAMQQTGGGVILFTSSISSLGHGRGFTSYARGQGRSGGAVEGDRRRVRAVRHPLQLREPRPGRHPAVGRPDQRRS